MVSLALALTVSPGTVSPPLLVPSAAEVLRPVVSAGPEAEAGAGPGAEGPRSAPSAEAELLRPVLLSAEVEAGVGAEAAGPPLASSAAAAPELLRLVVSAEVEPGAGTEAAAAAEAQSGAGAGAGVDVVSVGSARGVRSRAWASRAAVRSGLSAYYLTCRSPYDLMGRSVSAS